MSIVEHALEKTRAAGQRARSRRMGDADAERGPEYQPEKYQAHSIWVYGQSRNAGRSNLYEPFAALLTLKRLRQIGALQTVLRMLIFILQNLFASQHF